MNGEMEKHGGVFNWKGERESNTQGVGVRRNKRTRRMFEKSRINHIN